MNAMDNVKECREPSRKKSRDYINGVFDKFIEFHGDRCFSDDRSIICGIGITGCFSAVIVGQQKDVNHGMCSPEGYRKALRMIKYAEKFRFPVITFVDTPGAGCGIEAEQRGQSLAIANCIYAFSSLRVPTLSVIIGEGGSGGALALSVTDEIWMLEKSIYSILSPEGFASILWKDVSRKEEAADLMRLTSRELMEDGFIDRVIEEDGGEIEKVKKEIRGFLDKKSSVSIDKIIKKRYYKYRKII